MNFTKKKYPWISNLKKKGLDDPVCGAGYSKISLAANGMYYPCSAWQSYPVGNSYKETLQDVWKNSDKLIYLRSIRRKHLTKCNDCEAKNYCSFCFVRNFNENNGDMLTPAKHFCDVAFINKKVVEKYRKNNNNQ
ncbi:MAG: SPASM domain-containing protein [bacterium]|nr:SPASM domain-containing protein [bacterium]